MQPYSCLPKSTFPSRSDRARFYEGHSATWTDMANCIPVVLTVAIPIDLLTLDSAGHLMLK